VKAGEGRVEINSFGDLNRLVDASNGNSMTLVVKRDGKEVDVQVSPDAREARPGRYQLGVTVSPVPPGDAGKAERIAEFNKTVIAYGVRPGGVAEQAGVKVGDKIVGVKVNGTEVLNPEDNSFDRTAYQMALLKAAQVDGSAEFTYEIEREDGIESITIMTDESGPDSGAMMSIAAAEQRSDPVTYGLGESVLPGFYHSKKVGYKILMTLSALFTGRVKVWHLGGPVVIAKRSYSLEQWGIGTLLFFLAFISINLAIVNLIPLPVLDGGQWLIETIVAIRGKPLPEKALHWVQFSSFILVVGLMLFVLGNDLVTVFWRKWV